MKAMIFAAGLGTRLRPLTDDRPKALVTIGGRTLLEIALARLRDFGVGEAIVNVHHFADQIVSFLAANGNFGMRIEVSREDELLDTGGGLKKAAWFFLESDTDKNEPFLVHNVDVLSSIDLSRMVEFHRRRDALATLAVQERATSRPLLFDGEDRLVRRGEASTSAAAPERSAADLQPLAFCGIHVVSPRIFAKLDESGAFSIVDAYVRLAAQGESIPAYRADGAHWRDLGRPEHLAAAEGDLTDGTYPAS
jgi:NDP-sugar pyrophosphorylase family protein